ncbi:DUF3618 domain-containing protein [Pseudoroseomonas ludipueritiae]|uniref:DUF3618 domain-containing protein n=1 Tax=Pseudoroseomonas ludipueritiae TaxID=198093 RepID=A0ABR7RE09_9PROT|nr:DUF3618 domain-containing protein [Pseudoroseomonas ludipueritiae]MBC9179670.1 DUF3618 domain-containing protein [Pseudoroseomonas ludipueritiae]
MSATTDPGNRSAAEIEADVEQTRVRVAQTIDALRDSMSPGQIMDQVVDYARTSGGAEFTRNLGAQVRDNPLPVLLIGAGIGWLLLSNGNKSAQVAGPVQPLPPQRMLPPPAPPSPSTRMHVVHQSSGPGMMDRAAQAGAAVRDGVEQTATSVGSTIGQAASSVGGAISSAASAVGGAISAAASTASNAASSAAGAVSDAASSAAGTVSGMAGSAASAMGSARDSARAYGHDASHAASQGMYAASNNVNQFGQQVGYQVGNMGDQLRHSWNRASAEQPLLLGALGLALGAVIGALLPRTRTEDRLMGEASDAVTQQLSSAAQEQYQQAKEVVAERVGEVREKLGNGVPSVSSIGDAVVGAAEGVRQAVGQTARDLGDSAKASLDKQEEAVTGQKSDKPGDSKPADAKPGDYKPAGSSPLASKPGDTKPTDDKFVAKPDKPMQTI